jgi:hypothetical protein
MKTSWHREGAVYDGRKTRRNLLAADPGVSRASYRAGWLQCRAKRIGENFKALGTDMIDQPEALAIDRVSFNADVAITPRLLAQCAELTAARATKQAEVEKFGTLPRFAAARFEPF